MTETNSAVDSPLSAHAHERGRSEPAPIDISAHDFREIGHRLVDDIASFLDNIGEQRVAPGMKPSEVRAAVGASSLPESGSDAATIVADATELLFAHSTLNGHPRFFGYITAPAAPIGILGEMLAATVNANAGAWSLAPAATEIELQTIRWMAELIGYPADTGGLFVSGGNMANIVCFLAARAAAKSKEGLRCYASTDTHTWIEKAVDIAGLGASCITHLPVDSRGRASAAELGDAIAADRKAGLSPFFVVATAGSTNTGSIDPISDIAAVCKREGVWLHVDGAYGAPVAALPDAPADLRAIHLADSVAIDPHKWLYAPLEAGCALVRDRELLRSAFSHHPPYYHFDTNEGEEETNFYEFGPQNSRGFRALKVWLAFRQVGRAGYVKMIRQDIELAQQLYEAISAEPDLEAVTCELSIVTFAYVPLDLSGDASAGKSMEYLNALNQAVLTELQAGGDVFVSNAVIGERFLLRACIVNFRTMTADVLAVPGIVVAVGTRIDQQMRQDLQDGV